MSLSIAFFFKKIIATVIAGVMSFMCLSTPHKDFQAKNPEEARLCFDVLADCHVESNNLKSYGMFCEILRDIKKGDSDALAFLGDDTMNGQEIESLIFYGTVNNIKPSKNYINAVGNHDIGNGVGDYNELMDRFLGYNNAFLGIDTEKPYYYKVIDGCSFIVLAPEDQEIETIYISDEQYEWLSDTLTQVEALGGPIFVLCHYPVYYLRDGWYTLSDILREYDNVIFFSGHTHIDINEDSFYYFNGVESVNLPRCTEMNIEGYNSGIGARVEVYEDEVLVRIRNYLEGEFVEELERSYKLR